MSVFNVETFEPEFKKSIGQIAKAEKVTKETLRELSRDVLMAVHATGDISYYNRLTAVLTAINCKVAVLYGKAYTGFLYDEESKLFTKKSKKAYDKVAQECAVFLEDPHNNIWSWADRNVGIEPKEFDLKSVTAFITNALKKADKAGIIQSDVLKAVFAAGVTVDALIVAMESVEGMDVNVKDNV